MSWLIVDLETQNHEYFGQLASPFHPENYIVAAGYAINGGDIGHSYFDNKEQAESSNWLEQQLQDATFLVAHNATFEIQWFLSGNLRKPFLDFLKRGGRIWCTQYAEYLLSHQQDTYPSLEDTALKYGGSKKIDEVKLLWEQGVLTADIDRDLLVRYLAGPEGDIANTRLVCFKQFQRMQELGMLEMFSLRMDSLLYNAMCVYNGLHVDMEVAKRNHEKQLLEAQDIRDRIIQMLPADMPRDLAFNFGSDYHMSAFLFGGPIKYDTKVSYDPIKYEKITAYEIDQNGVVRYIPVDEFDPELHDRHVTVYKSGKNKGLRKEFKIDSTVEKLKWGECVYHFKGLIDFSDLPSHVSEEFKGKRAEFKGKRTLCDGVTPVYSSGKDALDILANFVEVAKPLKTLAQLDKDNGTYYIAHKYNPDGSIKESKGMLQFVGPDGIIHHSLNNCATVTTRLSSASPNLQNLPREGTSVVKEMFTSRHPNGYILEVDYTALEVVDVAAVSGDKNLLDKLVAGTDMHLYRLAGKTDCWMGHPYIQLVLMLEDKSHPLNKELKNARTNIKPKAFAAQYGASAHGISFATGCTLEEAQEFLDNEAALFPDVDAFKRYVRECVEKTGAMPESIHRECTDEGHWTVYRRGYFRSMGNTFYSFRQYSKNVRGQTISDYKDTQMANYPIQGESAFIVQSACARVIRWLIANDFFGGAIIPINTVHDALYLDCINEEWAIFAGQMVRQIMEDTPKAMCELMPDYEKWNYHTTPFPAVAEYGKNMMEKVKVH